MLNHLVEHDHLPDYHLTMQDNLVTFTNRGTMHAKPEVLVGVDSIRLDPDVYHEAGQVAGGWDVYALEQSWREWMAMGDMEPLRNPELAFIGFCRKWVERKGRA